VVGLLDPQPGEHVLDTCAAPGGKATAIAERVGREGSVLALDRNTRRLDLVRRSVRRLHLGRLRCEVHDANHSFAPWITSDGFDRVLVDAPCSGLGTLRRNPDARWRLQPADPARLAEIQLAFLRNAAAALSPGGVLVYSTCTLLPEENEAVIEAFLNEPGEFTLTPKEESPAEVQELLDSDGYMRCFPHRHDTDGFFAARLTRRT
jgi:16S rRNA (cytosine967-C5)-methyltransferase